MLSAYNMLKIHELRLENQSPFRASNVTYLNSPDSQFPYEACLPESLGGRTRELRVWYQLSSTRTVKKSTSHAITIFTCKASHHIGSKKNALSILLNNEANTILGKWYLQQANH